MVQETLLTVDADSAEAVALFVAYNDPEGQFQYHDEVWYVHHLSVRIQGEPYRLGSTVRLSLTAVLGKEPAPELKEFLKLVTMNQVAHEAWLRSPEKAAYDAWFQELRETFPGNGQRPNVMDFLKAEYEKRGIKP